MDSLETVTAIKKISFVFFVVLGATHFTAGALFSKNHFVPYSGVIMKILFIPFILASLAYAYGAIKEHLLFNGKHGKVIDYTFISIGIVAVIALLFLQFSFPDA